MKVVIRAGGSGTRLWPLSRKSFPKQFQSVNSDQSMIRDTYDRIKPLLKNDDDLIVSVNYDHLDLLKEQLPEVLAQNIIVEPSMKNTGPALCLEAFIIQELFQDDQITIATLPSDDYINSSKAFCEMLTKADNFLDKNPEYIVTPGTIPDTADVGYSYIKSGRKLQDFGDYITTYEVDDWIEKPGYEECQNLVESGEYFYHTGMYIWKVSTVLQLFKEMRPEIYSRCEEYIKYKKEGKLEKASDSYNKLEKMSVEEAITHDAPKKTMIVSNKVKWSDVGKWYVFPKLRKVDKFGNVIKGKFISEDTSGSVVFGKDNKLIATIGVQDLVIVDTEDILFISSLSKSGEVKDLLEDLKKKGLEEYL